MKDSTIQIIEKPDWVSWEDIKQCLYEAHAVNRAKGINMANYQWPAEKLKASVGENGIMLVALDGEHVVGTAAIIGKKGHWWYAPGLYAYMGFAGVHPDYNGLGVYRKLTEKREEIAKKKGYDLLVFDTHRDNKKIQTFAQKKGYRFVRYFRADSNDHYSVVMVKWLNGCPFSDAFIRRRFKLSKFLTKFFVSSGRINNDIWNRIYKRIKRRYGI